MILTDKGNRKPKEPKQPTYHASTYEELSERVEKMKSPKLVGKAECEYFGCRCKLVLPSDVEEDSKMAIWFFENVENHHPDCEYIWWMSI